MGMKSSKPISYKEQQKNRKLGEFEDGECDDTEEED